MLMAQRTHILLMIWGVLQQADSFRSRERQRSSLSISFTDDFSFLMSIEDLLVSSISTNFSCLAPNNIQSKYCISQKQNMQLLLMVHWTQTHLDIYSYIRNRFPTSFLPQSCTNAKWVGILCWSQVEDKEIATVAWCKHLKTISLTPGAFTNNPAGKIEL